MIKFYLDAHVPTAVANGLRQRGVDVLTVAEAEMLGADDETHLRLATSQGRVMFTQDADFLRLHATNIPHTGLAYAAQPMSIGDIVRGLMLIYDLLDPTDIENRVEFL